jgi:hypothetical protein
MSDYRQPVQDYILACEALLQMGELSKDEAEAVEKMFGQIADKFLDDAMLCENRVGIGPEPKA